MEPNQRQRNLPNRLVNGRFTKRRAPPQSRNGSTGRFEKRARTTSPPNVPIVEGPVERPSTPPNVPIVEGPAERPPAPEPEELGIDFELPDLPEGLEELENEPQVPQELDHSSRSSSPSPSFSPLSSISPVPSPTPSTCSF
jgi:hypothetical protein